MEKISWNDGVKNEEVLHRVGEDRNNLYAIKRKKAKGIGHILRRNCLVRHVIEERNDGKARKKTQAATE